MLDKSMKLGRYRSMTERKQKAYWLVAEALYEMRSEVTIPLYNDHELLEVYMALHYDFPELQVIWNYGASSYYENRQGSSVKSITWHLKYFGTRRELEDKMRKIDFEVDKIIRECGKSGNMNDRKWIKNIYAYLTKTLKYTEKPKNGVFPTYSFSLECLLHGDGVCAGIASVYAYILKKLHIPVMVVTGITSGGDSRGGHAWNIVELPDGTYRHVDVTWGLQQYYPKYLELDDLAMKARRHQWNVKEYPLCS